MDGVLIDARDWHYEALNEALDLFGYAIDYERHIEHFDGLPTKKKLNSLSENNGLPRRLHRVIEDVKQERTLRIASSKLFPRAQHLILLAALKRAGLKIGVATNSIRETSETMLTHAGLMQHLDILATNQDVTEGKPSPEIYLYAMAQLGLSPGETLVIEDNPNGVKAAKAAGCKVIQVESPDDVHLELILPHFEKGRIIDSI
jgi:HAD superfamily hydrolase (TIGR01509 family)